MRQREPGLNGLLAPLELIKHLPGEALQPASTHHTLLLLMHTPEEFEARSEGISRTVPPPAGSISVVPAGSPARWRWSSHSDSLHVFLKPELVARVAAEAFDLDSARVSVPPLDGLDFPQLRAAMLAVNDELTADAAGGRLVAESLANVLAVQLIRSAYAPRPPALRTAGALAQRKLHAVVEYVEEHLDAGLTLDQLAAVAHLSPYHFARQFKAATGMPPHQYVVARRVERAQQLLQQGDHSLAEVAACTGFSDQSQFCNHFKRLVGVTPGRFRMPARFA